MEDIAAFFRRTGLDKCNNMKTFQEKRRLDDNHTRRETRNTILEKLRNIDVNMSPYHTPESNKSKVEREKPMEKKDQVIRPINKRLEMLIKWKAEKEKNKLEEKKKAKPIFKVYHVKEEMGKNSLGNVNKEIKGKPIIPIFKSKFAPVNHEFKPPKNIKPIDLKYGKNSQKIEKVVMCQNSAVLKKGSISSSSQQKAFQSQNKVAGNSKISESIKIQKPLSRGNSKKEIKLSNTQEKKRYTRSSAKSSESVGSREKNILAAKIGDSVSNLKLHPKNEINQSVTKETKKNAGIKSQQKSKVKIENSRVVIEDGDNQCSSSLCTSNNNLPEIIYSDDEITMKTPKKQKQCTTYNKNRINKLKTSPKTPNSARKTLHFVTSKVNHETPGRPTKSPKSIINSLIPFSIKKTPHPRTINSTINNELDWHIDVISSSEGSGVLKQFKNVPPIMITPIVEEDDKSPTYISPFVTISRGKDSARKEFKKRQSAGGTYFNMTDQERFLQNSTSPQAAAEYFTKKLDDEITRIEGICTKWDDYKLQNDLSEEIQNMINVAIGQSRLLINKKFPQFRSLIEECRMCQYKEKPITCQDLHGYWDTAYIQVEDLNKRFANLDKMKDNSWEEVVPEKIVVKKRRGRPKKNAASSKLKDIIRAAREKNKGTGYSSNTDSSSSLISCDDSKNSSSHEKLEEKTPLRKPIIASTGSTGRRSLRVSLLSGQLQKKRCSSSPGLTLMKISQAIKCGDGLTPSKSILKTDLTRSEKRKNKSVLFSDDVDRLKDISFKLTNDEEKENVDQFNSICVTPTRTRKSTRNIVKLL